MPEIRAVAVPLAAFALILGGLFGWMNQDGLDFLIYSFGGEYGHVARAVVEGRGFSDPFGIGTGPTAWTPPLYVGMLVLLFSALGQGTTAAWGLLLLKWAALVGTAAVLLGCARGQRRAAWLPLVFLLLLMCDIDWLTRQMLDAWLVILVSALVLAGCLKLFDEQAPLNPVLLLSAALTPLTAPSLALGLGANIWRRIRGAKHRLLPVFACLLVPVLLWGIRCQISVGLPCLVKSNLGFDFYLSNVVDDDGISTYGEATSHHMIRPHTPFRAEYIQLGEAAFCRKYNRESLKYLAQDTVDFLGRTATRISNSMLYMHPPEDVWANPQPLLPQDYDRLNRALLMVQSGPHQFWHCLDLDESTFKRRLNQLDLRAPQLALEGWRQARSNSRRYLAWWPLRLRGVVLALVPTAALLLGFYRGWWRCPSFSVAATLYLLYLLPYQLVVHYTRYQYGILAIQAWLVWLVFVCREPSEFGQGHLQAGSGQVAGTRLTD